MLQSPRLLACAAFALAFLAVNYSAPAQSGSNNVNNSRLVPFTAVTDGHNVILSWKEMKFDWAVAQQQPAGTGEWKPVARELYHTNGTDITATLPLPSQTTLYRLRPALMLFPPAMPPMPKLPSPRTVSPPGPSH